MRTATVGEVQKNFAKVLENLQSGEEILVNKRGKAIAKITSLGPKKSINWPDFAEESIEFKGKLASELLIDSRGERV